MAKLTEKSLNQKLCEVMKPYLAMYLCWYYQDPETRCSWDELCNYDANFKQQGEHAGENKTQEFCEQNWLIRDDVQKGMIIYMQHMKRYQEMNKKALSGDVNSAKYVDEMDKLLDKMSVDNSTEDEIGKLLQGVNINVN